jgi:hypothetical protein
MSDAPGVLRIHHDIWPAIEPTDRAGAIVEDLGYNAE